MKKQKNTKVLPVTSPAKAAEKRLLDKANATESVAKVSGSIAQSFDRIKDIVDTGTGIMLILNPTPTDPRVSKTLSYEQALRHLMATKRTIPIMALSDQKSAIEMLVALESRLLEALTSTDVVSAGFIGELEK